MGSPWHAIHHIGRLRGAPDWTIEPHSHPHHELVLILTGEMETVMAGETRRTGPGMVKFHPRGVLHTERCTDPQGVTLVCMSWDTPAEIDHSRWPLAVADRTGRLRMLLEWMVELSPPLDAASQAAREGLLQAVAHAYASAVRSPMDELVLQVRTWVRAHLEEPIYLDDLARVAGISRYHFNRSFRQAAGMPPMRFVREMRVDAARSMLLNSRLPLKAIAPAVGFRDEFQLSRVFRQITGQSPAAVRRS